MKQNGVVFYPALLFFLFLSEYLISGLKSYRAFRETGPWPLKSIHVSRRGLFEIMSSLLRLERQQKKTFLKIHFEFAYFFLSYSIGIETINTFIRSRSFLENHTRFQTKTAQKPYPLGRHIPVLLIKGSFGPGTKGKRSYPETKKKGFKAVQSENCDCSGRFIHDAALQSTVRLGVVSTTFKMCKFPDAPVPSENMLPFKIQQIIICEFVALLNILEVVKIMKMLL